MSSATERLQPHHRLLLDSVKRSTPSRAEAEKLLGAALDWHELEDGARRNRLISFVHRLLESPSLAPLVETSIRGSWSDLHRHELARVDKKLTQLREVGELFDGAGVKALVYKGPDFSQRFYPEDCPRAFNDLDVVVAEADVAPAIAALEAAGYHLPPATPPLEYYRRFHFHAIYLHPQGGHPVELHWALESPYSNLPDIVPELLAEAVSGQELGPALLRPSLIDTLGLMALHLNKHLGICATLRDGERRLEATLAEGGLFWILDVLLWLRMAGGLTEPASLLDRMRRLGAEPALVVALRLALDVDETGVPAWARELGDRLPGPTPWVARIVYPDVPEPWRSTWRRFFIGTLPVASFRPSRVVEMLLPDPVIPGIDRPRPHVGRRGLLSRCWLAARNVWALLAWKTMSVVGSRATGERAERS